MGSLASRPKIGAQPQTVYLRPPDTATLEQCYSWLKDLAVAGTLELKEVNGEFHMAFYPKRHAGARFSKGAEICKLLEDLKAEKEG